ncbi:response regulator [Paenibacillus cisolokensis]|uniref:response regulator transcription factor n=1 Tax=Paenibacillus cisolokensis TaxID=1658519 RepID=UPI003D287881
MYRLLIIDDETIIVNGLHEYFLKRCLKDVEIVLAYSAEEAVSWLDAMKIDVVLSDICMPGMDGMELLGHIEKRWPRCKVILLTGHDKFDYAHRALRSGSVIDYILKTEGMERIGEAVDRALAAVKDELSVYHQKEWLQRELPKAIAQLQRQLLLDVLRRTEEASLRGLQTEFDAVKLPLSAGEPVLVLSLFVEDWGKYQSVHERDLMLFAIGNIAEELLGSRTVAKCVPYDGRSLVGLIQPQGAPDGTAEREERAASFAHGTLETIQEVCRDLFGIPVSAAASGRFLPFEKLAREAHRLRLAVLNGGFKGNERLTFVQDEDGGRGADPSGRLSAQYLLEQMRQSLLESGGGEWTEHYGKFVRLFPEDGPEDPFDRMLVLQALCRLCIVCLEELGLKDRAVSQANLAAMLHFGAHTRWVELVAYFQSLLEWMQNARSDHLRLTESNLVGRIHYFVRNNLGGDLSMSRIAREVSLNPSYLSRWYKQTCGKGLSEYIQEARVERSKELLRTTACRIHEISEMLGFADPHYFYRFFKKAVGCTPQEYRNRNAS